MMAATFRTCLQMNGPFSSAPDTPSPVYPGRLIRPLPKRSLRSRLPSEAAGSILYPLSPPVTQLFYGSTADNGDLTDDARAYVQPDIDSESQEHSSACDHRHTYENGVDYETDDEDGPVVVRRSTGFRGSSLSPTPQNARPPKYAGSFDGSEVKSFVGPDGYDAFENTNNKKKRKIPTPASLSNHQSTLSQDFANMGLSGPESAISEAAGSDGINTGTYYGTGNPASPVSNGISGSGRGRFSRGVARSSSGRGPLTVHNQNGWANSRVNRRDQHLSSSDSIGENSAKNDQGIISTAIANAAVLSSSPNASDNTSLLDRQHKSPTKTQFTFTCESDSSKGMALQAQSTYALQQRQRQQYRSSASLPMSSQTQRGFSTQGTQTSPNMTSHTQAGQQQQQQQQQQGQGNETGGTGRKKKRSPGSLYALAARQRKIQQQYANLHHPPATEDVWICEFCEYESIFGHPPEALIRQYEIKDRKERKHLAEKKRLLEKAKMKGRKGKKATKKSAAAQQTNHQHHQGCCDRTAMEAQCYHHEDDCPTNEYEDYDEEPVPPASAPAPSSAPVKSSVPPSSIPKKARSASGVNDVRDGGTRPPA